MLAYDRFKTILRPLSNATAGRPWSRDQIKSWYSVLKGFDEDQLIDAVARLAITKRNAFIEPSDVIQALADQILGRVPDAGEAYKRLTAARKVWYPADADCCRKARAMLDPITLEALKGVGGFAAAFEVDNEQVFLAQFTRSYERVVKRAVETRVLPSHLRPKELPAGPSKSVTDRPTPAIGRDRPPLPSQDGQRYAMQLARKLSPPEDRPAIEQTEEQASAVRAAQERRLKERLARRESA